MGRDKLLRLSSEVRSRVMVMDYRSCRALLQRGQNVNKLRHLHRSKNERSQLCRKGTISSLLSSRLHGQWIYLLLEIGQDSTTLGSLIQITDNIDTGWSNHGHIDIHPQITQLVVQLGHTDLHQHRAKHAQNTPHPDVKA